MGEETRSAGEGLERSCQNPGAGWLVSARPAAGVELFSAWLAGEAYQRHRHDSYAVGLTDSGVQIFDYRGSARTSVPGQVVTLYPDEVHNAFGLTPGRYRALRDGPGVRRRGHDGERGR